MISIQRRSLIDAKVMVVLGRIRFRRLPLILSCMRNKFFWSAQCLAYSSYMQKRYFIRTNDDVRMQVAGKAVDEMAGASQSHLEQLNHEMKPANLRHFLSYRSDYDSITRR